MSVAQFLQSMTAETATLMVGLVLLFVIVVSLQIRNNRWVRNLATREEAAAEKARVERLLRAVEGLAAGSKRTPRIVRNRPLDKGTKRIPAIRSAVLASVRKQLR